MSLSELVAKVKRLIFERYTGIITVKLTRGRIVWAKVPRDL